jgi:dihydrofolate synthase / folylpolyglutamate synthase
MTYQETIHYLFTRLPMFSRLGAAAIRKDLTNTIVLCEKLGNPQHKFKSIHIAGTNGKGSTSHMMAAILQTAGYKTGLYTSPHLKDFRERIKINGQMIEEKFVVDFTKRIMPVIDEIEPSFFEITVAMAFEYFVVNKIDIAVIETGLGGRLDSTNIILPELSVITNIGWDHMNLLGDTLEKIAFEKAGIIKNKVPVVIGETSKESKPVFTKRAREEESLIQFADENFHVMDWEFHKHDLRVSVDSSYSKERLSFDLDLMGYYQTKNLLTVLQTVHQLQELGWKIFPEHIHTALKQVKKLTGLHGRWETIHSNPTVVLDVAHNEDGIRQLTEQLEFTNHHHLHIVLGLVKDKEIDKVLSLLPKDASYYFTRASIPRALPETTLAEKAAEAGLQGQHFPEVNAALKSAMANADKNDLILVCGSVFVVGEVNLQS